MQRKTRCKTRRNQILFKTVNNCGKLKCWSSEKAHTCMESFDNARCNIFTQDGGKLRKRSYNTCKVKAGKKTHRNIRRKYGGNFNDWNVQVLKNPNENFTSYYNSKYGDNKHCTIWKTGDIHCKVNGERKCGCFSKNYECEDTKSGKMYDDFIEGLVIDGLPITKGDCLKKN